MAVEPLLRAPSPIHPPTQATGPRRLLHILITAAAWGLFLYWWWLVMHRVSAHEVRFTVLFIVISLAVVVLVTAAWAFHNLSIFERRGPRRQIRDVRADYSRDRLGREVAFRDAADLYRLAPVVYVRMTDAGKTYEARGIVMPKAVTAASAR